MGESASFLSEDKKKFLREVATFGAVGGTAFIVDVGVFNLLRFAGPGLLEDRPVTAKFISVAVATVVAWLGNRHLTYKNRKRTESSWREFRDFAIINVIGLGFGAGCLAFSHYVLGLDSPLADNISANVVGLALGTMFRFAAYRWWLFPEEKERGDVDHAHSVADDVVGTVTGHSADDAPETERRRTGGLAQGSQPAA